MLEQETQFPDSLTLNGADYFCLQLDKLMWKASAKRNVCTFVVTLQEQLTLIELSHQLSDRPAYQWLCRLRLQEGLPFSLAKWVHHSNAELPAIHEYPLTSAENLPENALFQVLEVKSQSPFKIDLYQITGAKAASILVFTWHHALMDAHGGELFIRYLGLPLAAKSPEWVVPDEPQLPLKSRAKIASEMKDFLYKTASLPLLSLYKKTPVKPQTRFRVLSFTPDQTQAIHEQAKQRDAAFLASAFYLACTMYAVAQVQQRGKVEGDVLVPVPLDRRKRGAPGAILHNQVSFLFYRIQNAMLNDVSAMTAELIAQMKSLIRSESPSHYVIMMDFLRRLPGFFYRKLLKAPTKGLMASFYYSDTGDSLQDFTLLFGQSVNGAVHYPPNMYPPGLTFIFSRCQGALQITVGYMEPDIKSEEIEQLLTGLQNTLLGE